MNTQEPRLFRRAGYVARILMPVTAIILTMACLGCNNRFPQSRLYLSTNLKSFLLNKPELKEGPSFGASSSEEVCPEYETKDVEVVVTLKKGLQASYVDAIMAAVTNQIVGSGSTITGDGNSGSINLPNDVSIHRYFDFETQETTGKIRLDAVALDEARLNVTMSMFECRRIRMK